MRFSNLPTIVICLLMLASVGCRSTTNLQCEREIALMRSEILDLEDKYYALKSDHENGGLPTRSDVIATSGQWPVVNSGEVIYEDQLIQGQIVGQPYNGQIVSGQHYGGQIIDGQIIGGQIIDGQIIDGHVLNAPIVNGQIISNGVILPGVIGSGVVEPMTPTPAVESRNLESPADQSEIFEFDFNDSSTLEEVPRGATPRVNDQATQQMDGPEWEIGFANSSIESTVDRIEILSSLTRGKNLDGQGGDDGVEVMVQPLDIDGRFVDADGELTVTIFDEQVGQIGKWTFLPAELKLFLSRDEFDNMGILLHLPWADRNPVGSNVDIKVTMLVNGITYSDTKRIRIASNSDSNQADSVSDWTPSDRRRFRGSGSTTKSTYRSNRSESGTSGSRSTAIERPQWRPVR